MTLTPRQEQVLKLVADGLSSPEIARVLQLSVSSVDTHRRDIRVRLGMDSLADLIKYAIYKGLTEPYKPPSTPIESCPPGCTLYGD